MRLGLRIFLAYFLFVGLSGYFVLSTVMDEIRPGVRLSTEETLVDTASLHGGALSVANAEGGVAVCLRLPSLPGQ